MRCKWVNKHFLMNYAHYARKQKIIITFSVDENEVVESDLATQ